MRNNRQRERLGKNVRVARDNYSDLFDIQVSNNLPSEWCIFLAKEAEKESEWKAEHPTELHGLAQIRLLQPMMRFPAYEPYKDTIADK